MTDRPVLRLSNVDRETWPDLVALFEARGGPSFCWCMVWRPKPRGASKMGSKPRKGWLHDLVEQDVPIGIVGYLEDEPVAWCSIGPRASHRKLGGPEDFADDPDAVWSLTCFFVLRRFRGHALIDQLIAGAIERAREGGARLVEAYPVPPDAPSYRFMGRTTAFERAGFVEVGTAGYRRRVMRLQIG